MADEIHESIDSPIIDGELGKLAQSPIGEIEIDWEEYFNQFCKAHGTYPVVYHTSDDVELLLFQDGWSYSSTHHSGPEYPPPTDKLELINLRLYYWKRRLSIVKRDHDTCQFNLEQLMNIVRSKSLPLYQRIQLKDNDGRVITQSNKLDTLMIKKRIEWLEYDMDRCEKEIYTLERQRDKLIQNVTIRT